MQGGYIILCVLKPDLHVQIVEQLQSHHLIYRNVIMEQTAYVENYGNVSFLLQQFLCQGIPH